MHIPPIPAKDEWPRQIGQGAKLTLPDQHQLLLSNRFRLLIGLVVALVYLFGAIVVRQMLLGDPDIWWHIKTGQWIWQHGGVPHSDPFSFTFAGKPWIAKEWLSQIIYYATYALAGWNGLAALAALVVAISAAGLYWGVSASLRPSLAASVALVSLLVTSSAITVRPHLLTLPLLIVWTAALFNSSARQRAPNFLLLFVIAIWANLHAAFTIGFIIAFFAFLDFLVTARLANKKELLKWAAFLALCPLVTLVHPYSYQAIMATLLVFRLDQVPIPISEWQPFNAELHPLHAMALLGLVFASLVSGFRLGFARTLLVLLLTYLFLTHVRYAFYLFPVLALVAAPAVAQQFPRTSAEQWRAQSLDPVEQRMASAFRPLAAIFAGMIALAIGLQLWVIPTAPPEKVAATSAIAYAKSHGLSGHVMNFYDFGGPFIFNDIPTFVDGRTDQLFIGDFRTEVEAALKDPADLLKTLGKYDIRWTIFPPSYPVTTMLDKLPGWKRVYVDKFAVIHQRQDTITNP